MRKAAGCIVQNGDKFLLIRRSSTDNRFPGIWECPAGRIEEGESPREAALRETKEESGLEVEIIKDLGIHETDIDGDHKAFYCFLTRAKNIDVTLSFEHDAFKWLTLEEYSKMSKEEGYDSECKKIGHHTRFFFMNFFLKKLQD
jgi:8-oxo-dGTP pyrophosphatase MutT (NUDIX family)